MKKGLKGKEGFMEYYQNYLPALKKENIAAIKFKKSEKEEIAKLFEKEKINYETFKWYQNAIRPKFKIENSELFKRYYRLNASSLLPPLALNIQEGDKVLDACSAPGGKSLILAEQLNNTGELILNDLSSKRMQRLKNTINNFSNYQNPKFLIGNAATLFKKYPNYFDKILLDAPCSSEKHVYNSPQHLKNWSKGRIKQLTYTQKSLLNGLFLALKPGGILVYSTCSINEEENEKAIEKFLKKQKEKSKIIPFPKKYPGWQKDTPFGKIDILNPKYENFDPMFIAIIQKI